MGYTERNNTYPLWVGDRPSMVPHPDGVEIAWDDIALADPHIDENGGKFVKSGTIMAQHPTTLKMVPHQLAVAGYTDIIGVIQTNANQGSKSDALTGYGVFVTGPVRENLFPEFNDAWYNATGRATLVTLGFGLYLHADNRS